MKMIEFYAPPALKKFLLARASGSASKELMTQLSEAAMAEQEADRLRTPRTTTLDEVVIDFQHARLARSQVAPTGQIDQPEAS
jgi:hypothetical protein